MRPVLTVILSVGFPTIIFQSNKPGKALCCRRQDLGKGLRTTAKTVVSAEQNLREGLTQAALAMNDIVWPAVKRRAPIVRGEGGEGRGGPCRLAESVLAGQTPPCVRHSLITRHTQIK